MNLRRQELEHIKDSIRITESQFNDWKNSDTTRRLLAELELDYWNTVEDHSKAYSPNVELIAISFREKAERSSLLHDIINWLPQELMRDE